MSGLKESWQGLLAAGIAAVGLASCQEETNLSRLPEPPETRPDPIVETQIPELRLTPTIKIPIGIPTETPEQETDYSSEVIPQAETYQQWSFECDIKEGSGISKKYCSPCYDGELATKHGMVPAKIRTCETFVDSSCSSGISYGISYEKCE